MGSVFLSTPLSVCRLSRLIPRVLVAAALAALPGLCEAPSYLITTVAGGGVPLTPAPATSISLPATAVATGAHGEVYFVLANCVFKMGATGVVTRIAGTSQGYSGDGGPALNAQLNYPFSLAVDGSANVFIADTGNYVVRKVAATTGIITTVAGIKIPGNGSPGSSGDGGAAARAGLSDPTAVAVDGFGNLYIADNYLVRKVAAATGIITTVAGSDTAVYPGDGSPATTAGLGVITGLAVDGSSNLYILSPYSYAIRKVTAATGIITTIAGNGTAGYTGDGGPAASAKLLSTALAVSGSGDIYIADYKDNVIRKVAAATGIITTVAGNGAAGYSGDGGPATGAQLNTPNAVAVDGPGNIYIADTANNVVREVVAATGIITTVAGNGAEYYAGNGGPATGAQLLNTLGVALDGSGNLYLTDFSNKARKVAKATGIITTVAGSGAAGYSGDGGPAINAELYQPFGIAVDSSGDLFIADYRNQRHQKSGGDYRHHHHGGRERRSRLFGRRQPSLGRQPDHAPGRGSGWFWQPLHCGQRQRRNPQDRRSHRDYYHGGRSRYHRFLGRRRPGHQGPAQRTYGSHRGQLRQPVYR